MRHYLTAGWMGLMLALQVGCASPSLVVQDTLGLTESVTIQRQQSGSDSNLTSAGQWLVNCQVQLDTFNSSEIARLEVDFDTESLVLITLGEQPTSGYWVEIMGASQLEDRLYVQGVANRPSEGAVTAQDLTYPYGAAVISKTDAGLLHPEIESVEGQAKPGSE